MLATVCQHKIGVIRLVVEPGLAMFWHYKNDQIQVLPRQSAGFSPILSGELSKSDLIERRPEGGRARSFHVSGTAAADVLPIIKAHVNSGTHIMTDEAGQYARIGKHFAGHSFTTHGAGEYVRGDVHTNTAEGFYASSLFGVGSHDPSCLVDPGCRPRDVSLFG